jgi:hypothetical protein
MLEYQKSSAALGLATQLIDGGKFLNTITASSMRNPPTNPILTQRAQQ